MECLKRMDKYYLDLNIVKFNDHIKMRNLNANAQKTEEFFSGVKG